MFVAISGFAPTAGWLSSLSQRYVTLAISFSFDDSCPMPLFMLQLAWSWTRVARLDKGVNSRVNRKSEQRHVSQSQKTRNGYVSMIVLYRHVSGVC